MLLAKIQKHFKTLMTQPAHHLDDCESDVLALFEEGDIAARERLKIYHNNVTGSLIEALRGTYPIIEKLVGENFFKAAARGFIFNHPPTNGCLHEYGQGFDIFIKDHPPAQSLPYLADIAALEFALNTAYYAPDDAPLAPDALSQIAPDDLAQTIVPLRASATLIQSKYPVIEIRDFCLDETQNHKPDITQLHQTKLLIIRPHLEVHLLPLAADEYMALDLLTKKTPLGETVETTMTKYQDFDFASFLQKHSALETFSAMRTNTPT